MRVLVVIVLVSSLQCAYHLSAGWRRSDLDATASTRHASALEPTVNPHRLFVTRLPSKNLLKNTAHLGRGGTRSWELQSQPCRFPGMRHHPSSRWYCGGWDGIRAICAPNIRLRLPCLHP